MRELRAEVQTAIVTAVATSDRTELIRGHCAWEAFFLLQNCFRLTLRFVNSHAEVGVASDVQLSSHRTHRPPQPFTVWHQETDCHVGKFVRASLSLRVWTSVHVRFGLRLCTCTSANARGGWCVGVFACMCVCLCVSIGCAKLCAHVSLHVSLHVCVMWIMCASYELHVCVLVYATINTCGNNATDERLKNQKQRRVQT